MEIVITTLCISLSIFFDVVMYRYFKVSYFTLVAITILITTVIVIFPFTFEFSKTKVVIYYLSIMAMYVASIPAILAKSPTLEILEVNFLRKKLRNSELATLPTNEFIQQLTSSGFVKRKPEGDKVYELTKLGKIFLTPFIIIKKITCIT